MLLSIDHHRWSVVFFFFMHSSQNHNLQTSWVCFGPCWSLSIKYQKDFYPSPCNKFSSSPFLPLLSLREVCSTRLVEFWLLIYIWKKNKFKNVGISQRSEIPFSRYFYMKGCQWFLWHLDCLHKTVRQVQQLYGGGCGCTASHLSPYHEVRHPSALEVVAGISCASTLFLCYICSRVIAPLLSQFNVSICKGSGYLC